jgi:hypothetical protein
MVASGPFGACPSRTAGDVFIRKFEGGLVVLYVTSKAFWLVAQPAHLLILLITLAVVFSFTRWRRLGVALAAFVALLVLIITVLPVGSWLLSPLENRFPPLRQMPAHVDGIIMLGGNESIAFTDLARRYPKAKLVFTGGWTQRSR